MATLKLDNIAVEVLKRAKGEFDSAFTPGGGVMPSADFLTAAQITSYVNKALQKLFSDALVEAKGDLDAFANVFPELVVNRIVSLTALSTYDLASPNLDYHSLVSGAVDGKFGTIAGKELRQLISSGTIEQYAGSADEPIIIEVDETFYNFPSAAFTSGTAIYTIIKRPVDPTTGNLLIQNGSFDSPYREIWLDKLAEIAFVFYKEDSTVQS